MKKKISFTKPLRTVNRVFIHYSATNNPDHDDINIIRDWHVNGNGWVDVGYHYFIQADGTVQTGRGINLIPAAQKGHNINSIAICLHGLNVEDFTRKQFKALRQLCKAINQAYNGNITFHGHHEVNPSSPCPHFDYRKVLNLDENGKLQKREVGKLAVRVAKWLMSWRLTRVG